MTRPALHDKQFTEGQTPSQVDFQHSRARMHKQAAGHRTKSYNAQHRCVF